MTEEQLENFLRKRDREKALRQMKIMKGVSDELARLFLILFSGLVLLSIIYVVLNFR